MPLATLPVLAAVGVLHAPASSDVISIALVIIAVLVVLLVIAAVVFFVRRKQ
jgi:hypothetical protein